MKRVILGVVVILFLGNFYFPHYWISIGVNPIENRRFLLIVFFFVLFLFPNDNKKEEIKKEKSISKKEEEK